jgi:hypothetical protein
MYSRFKQMSNKTNKYSPTSEDGARFDYHQLRERLSYLREKIIKEQDLLDITPNDNIGLKSDCLEKLIVFKVELRKTENEFKSVKKWFDKNNLPYPYSEEDQQKKEQSRKLREEYISLIKKKIKRRLKGSSKPKGKGGRPRDPNLNRKKDKLRKDYYNLTEKKGIKKAKAIRILSGKYEWKKSTIETYLK